MPNQSQQQAPVTLDMSTAVPLQSPAPQAGPPVKPDGGVLGHTANNSEPVTLDMSTAVPLGDVTSEAARLGGPLGAAAIGALKGASEGTSATISAPPQLQPWEKAAKAVETVAQIPTDPIDLVSHALGSLTDSLSNYTPEGRAEHPILSKVGDALNAARELLTGGQSARKPMGTRSGVLNNPVTVALSAAPGAEEAATAVQDRLLQAVQGAKEAKAVKAAEQAAKAESDLPKLTEGFLKFAPEAPKPMHGTPLTVESPLDSATISKEGGKGLSPEAVEALQHRQGNTIPVGSTTKNMLMRDVQPNSQVIEELATQMNNLVESAPPLDESVWDSGDVQQDLADLKAKIPASVRKAGAEDVDDITKDARDALDSKDLNQILEYRRQLGRQTDWENIAKTPATPAETVNSARAIIYRALGEKVHEAVPDTVPIDAELQPNIELRSYYRNRLGDRAVDDPVGATAEAKTEFAKGKKSIAVARHNAQVAKNRALAWRILGPAIAGVTGASGYEIAKHVAGE